MLYITAMANVLFFKIHFTDRVKEGVFQEKYVVPKVKRVSNSREITCHCQGIQVLIEHKSRKKIIQTQEEDIPISIVSKKCFYTMDSGNQNSSKHALKSQDNVAYIFTIKIAKENTQSL